MAAINPCRPHKPMVKGLQCYHSKKATPSGCLFCFAIGIQIPPETAAINPNPSGQI